MVEARVRFPVAAPRRSSPTGRRRLVQDQDSQGSNPWGGTQGKESEPGRSRASLLTSARLRPWASIAPLSAAEDEAVRARPPVGSRAGRPAVWGSRPLSSARESEPARCGHPFEAGWARKRWGSGPPLSAGKVKPPGAVTGLNPAGCASTGVRVLRLPLATTQLVDGSCLMNRCCSVRFRGGQLTDASCARRDGLRSFKPA
jgi:hypothetical protein